MEDSESGLQLLRLKTERKRIKHSCISFSHNYVTDSGFQSFDVIKVNPQCTQVVGHVANNEESC